MATDAGTEGDRSAELGRTGREISYRSDLGVSPANVAAYLVEPAAQHGCGVIVVEESGGLTDEIREVCERLGRAGFVALAPDLRRDADSSEDRRGSLDLEQAAADLDAAVGELQNQNATDGARVGILGFSLGGQLALSTAARNPRIGAAIDFYGLPAEARPDWTSVTAPLLVIFAAEDAAVSEPAVLSLEADLGRAGIRARVEIRDGLRHGFMNAARADVFDAVAAAQSWDTVLAFLRAELS